LLSARSGKMLPCDGCPVTRRFQREIAPPAALRLLHEPELLARQREVEVGEYQPMAGGAAAGRTRVPVLPASSLYNVCLQAFNEAQHLASLPCGDAELVQRLVNVADEHVPVPSSDAHTLVGHRHVAAHVI
jgi:hypothetical protein